MCLIVMIALFLLLIAGMTWRDMRIGERIERTNETVRVLGNSITRSTAWTTVRIPTR